MNLLIDTCVFLWATGEPERLSTPASRAIRDGDTEVYVSVVTLWEVLLKHGKGQLELDTRNDSALGFLLDQCEIHHFTLLGIDIPTLEPLERLPRIHRDPFDRMLICQVIEHGLALVTPDAAIRHYPIKTFW